MPDRCPDCHHLPTSDLRPPDSALFRRLFRLAPKPRECWEVEDDGVNVEVGTDVSGGWGQKNCACTHSFHGTTGVVTR